MTITLFLNSDESQKHLEQPPQPPTVQSTLKFPSMREGGVKMLPNDGHLPLPPSVTASIGPGHNYFGGRMTETRLKEVGRMTKETIQHLHKYIHKKYFIVVFCF